MKFHPNLPKLVLCLVGGWAALMPARADDEDVAAGQPTPASAAPVTPGLLRLSTGQQASAGLNSQVLKPVSLQLESTTYGKVLDIQPLLNLRAGMKAAEADIQIAITALTLAEKNRDRIRSLHDADIVASRELAQAEAQWQGDRTREESARRRAGEIRREAVHGWGAELAGLALDEQSPLLESLANHRRLLLQVTLPPGMTLPDRKTSLFVARDFDRAHAVRAELISAAPRTDELAQGETWFFHAPGEHLRAGMRLNVWMPGGQPRHGVQIPLTAVVWQDGKSWVYRDNLDGSYTRLPVDTRQMVGKSSLFVDEGLVPGARVVVTGAQTLLSEEFRQRIPPEDHD